MLRSAMLASSLGVVAACGFHHDAFLDAAPAAGDGDDDDAAAGSDRDGPLPDGPADAPVDDAPAVTTVFVFEAEAAGANVRGTGTKTPLWTAESAATEPTVTGYSGGGFLHLLPGDGYGCTPLQCAAVGYPFTSTVTGTYYLHLRLYATPGGANDSVLAGLDGTAATGHEIDVLGDSAWHWAPPLTVALTAGLHSVWVWQREAGIRMDLVVLSPTMADPQLP
jgi:hypothetical protein